MTRPKLIRMNPNRLPPLTKAQTERVKLFRKQFKDYGKVSVIRKGQKPGHVLITVRWNDQVEAFQYDAGGHLTDRWSQGQLFDGDAAAGLIHQPINNPYGDT